MAAGARAPAEAATPTKATAADEGQRRPTVVGNDQKRAQTTRPASFGPVVRFFFYFSCFYILSIVLFRFEAPQQPMTANKGQQRPTKTKKGPNDARRIVWVLGMFFF